MTQFEAHLEIGEDGDCMARILSLPGCFVRARSESAAFQDLPDTIRWYDSWLRQHWEAGLELQEPVTIRAAATAHVSGPFHPGGEAALFDPELEPITDVEISRFLQLAAYNRAELLALIRPLSPSVRQWQSSAEAMSIDRILRHIGRAELWYVSRLGDAVVTVAETGTVRQFLDRARETAVTHFQSLDDTQKQARFTPQHDTDNPQEPWTAWKALRRLLEHEREHIQHIHEVLAKWRGRLLADLAKERANLLWQLNGLEEETMSNLPVSDGWTVKDILAHIGAWDAFHAERTALVMHGRLHEIEPVGGKEGMDARNLNLLQLFRDVPFLSALGICLKERSSYQATLSRLTDAELHREIRLPWGWRTRLRVWAGWRARHDAVHAAELRQWRQTVPKEAKRTGSKSALAAIYNASRREVVTMAELLDEEERVTRPVCGVWTLKDLTGHLLDWELVGLAGLRQIVAGHLPEFEAPIPDFDAFNNANAAARQDQSWDDVWDEFLAVRAEMMSLMGQLSGPEMERTFATPWGTTIWLYRWLLIWPGHEREHAHELREVLGV